MMKEAMLRMKRVLGTRHSIASQKLPDQSCLMAAAAISLGIAGMAEEMAAQLEAMLAGGPGTAW
jgi:hypothetical protein